MTSPTPQPAPTPASPRTEGQLPDVATIRWAAPLGWLSAGWADLWRAPLPCLAYGLVLAALSACLAAGMTFTGYGSWILVLAGGFLFVAPMMAMGLYEAGRRLEQGETPTLAQMVLVRTASARDLAFLGLALMLVYFLWGRMAQLIYMLSTPRLHKSGAEFLQFMFTTQAGITMAVVGAIVGGIIALLAYSLIVISAPMLLDRRTDVFVATVTSVRSVTRNFAPMLLWAFLIAALTAIGIATAFIGLIIIFPWIGLASWHAYRELVPSV